MDIHKSKPWRGWREFLKEIGTIVIGVMIALGGEQAVEALHWKHQADAGEAALKEAFVREVDNAALREAQAGCVAQRLALLSSIVAQGAETGRLPRVGGLGHPPYTPWAIGAWEAMVASQTVSHLPRQKAITYTTIAQRTAYLSALSDREEDQWATLDSMVGPGRRLSDVEAEQLRTTLSRAAVSNFYMRRTSANLSDAIRATGLLAPSVFADAARRAAEASPGAAICRPPGAATPAGAV
jgi:hypothetical protein